MLHVPLRAATICRPERGTGEPQTVPSRPLRLRSYGKVSGTPVDAEGSGRQGILRLRKTEPRRVPGGEQTREDRKVRVLLLQQSQEHPSPGGTQTHRREVLLQERPRRDHHSEQRHDDRRRGLFGVRAPKQGHVLGWKQAIGDKISLLLRYWSGGVRRTARAERDRR